MRAGMRTAPAGGVCCRNRQDSSERESSRLSHKFGADPYALAVDGRVYLYNTYDALEYDGGGNVKDNSYSTINKLSVISSSDLVNWTDHGAIQVAGPTGAAAWATQSWAPAAAHKVIDGEDRFFCILPTMPAASAC